MKKNSKGLRVLCIAVILSIASPVPAITNDTAKAMQENLEKNNKADRSQIFAAFEDFAVQNDLRYNIKSLLVGNEEEYIMITTDAEPFDDPELQQWGYTIDLYRYANDQVVYFANLPQSMSAGPWYLLGNKLYSYARRGGVLRLDIDSGYQCERIMDSQVDYLDPASALSWPAR